jgi:hypothetical protein
MGRLSGAALAAYTVLGGLALFLFTKKAKAAAAGASPSGPDLVTLPATTSGAAGYEIPASMVPAQGPVTAATAIWSNLTPTAGPSMGSVNFPSGSQAASVFLPFASDGQNLYTLWSGEIYIVNPSPDLLGNYNARLLGS